MAIIDCVTYNGEKELFEIRYNILKDYVDEFIVIEFDTTFSGKKKPFYFEDLFLKYTNIGGKPFIRYAKFLGGVWQKYRNLAEGSPNTIGSEHWKLEFMQKESISDALTHLKDEDIVFIGDCDEIWRPKFKYSTPAKLKLDVYTYYFNNHSNEQFWGTIVAQYKDIKGKCLNHLRTSLPKTMTIAGWHFTSLKDSLYKKLTDSYTKESYATKEVLAQLESNVENNRDFLGRDFHYQVDESEWPQYLKDNKSKYLHLCK